ncbi:GDCCVxC domain-containing (seleno)protein [Zooshikella ganghwensis]|uniref:GDCCVxC domain-containing (seleno)protein n=2 Tax=Zooshikella ganghwensis TaxID=202772 RepID=UPI001F17AD8B
MMVEPPVTRESIITCPQCGYKQAGFMPTNACQWFLPCESCKFMMRPKPGDCCVFCSYGTVPCPSKQRLRQCG